MMPRFHILSFSLALLAFCPCCPPACGASATLRIDGIVHVPGLSMSGARMIIITDDGRSEVVVSGLEHFSRELPLQTAFLIGFEREGCVTKQLYFDTHVPGEAMARAPFDFPFEVTLERPPTGQNFHYAGPVGYIRYFPERQDFGYDTDYHRIADPKMAAQMLQALDHPTAQGHKAEEAHAEDPLSFRAAGQHSDTDAFNVIVPTRPTREALVHPTGDQDPRSTERPQAAPQMPEAAVKPAPVPSIERIPALAEPALHQPEITLTPPFLPAATTDPDAQREEELIVEPQWIIKIIRLSRSGTTDEFRRVEHKYGAVYFFKNGSTCSQYVYDLAVGKQPPAR